MAHRAQALTPAPRRRKWEWPWWVSPAGTVTALGLFTIYSLWETLTHSSGQYHNYLSPFFSPDVRAIGIQFLPAIWVVWAPLLFRATCYYYRKAYYRSFFSDPLACARPERPGRAYTGETKLPFVLSNLHRFFFYVTVVVMAFLWYDAIRAFIFPNGFGVGVGSLLMLLNVILLSVYTFSCHAFRHLIGGGLDCFSCSRGPILRYSLWKTVSKWNQEHATWAWLSMFSVWATDLYIRLLISGVLHDVRLF